MNVQRDDWPACPLEEWADTFATLHMMTQVVGKVRLACAPMVNHWWQVAFYVTPRGLTTSAMPHAAGTFEIAFDFIDHALRIDASDGRRGVVPLRAVPVADFHREVMALLTDLDHPVSIMPRPVEVERAIPFDEDYEHRAYVPEHAQRFWRVLLQADRVLHEFRGGYLGKCSPVHFFWGSFDLCVTRFSGRTAPPHPGGIPNLADWVTREAYSHECSSVGFWPGGGAVPEPAFYAYAYPEPPGFARHPVRPREAAYNDTMREFILPYEAVRHAADPRRMLLEFCQTTYEAAALPGGWDRERLERRHHSHDAARTPGDSVRETEAP